LSDLLARHLERRAVVGRVGGAGAEHDQRRRAAGRIIATGRQCLPEEQFGR
jgi:hypothetical protein